LELVAWVLGAICPKFALKALTTPLNKPILIGMQERKTKDLVKKYCRQCSEMFMTSIPNKIYCSIKCSGESFKERTGRSSALKLPTATVGAISELKLSTDLMTKGYSVFRALSAACFCDFIAIKDDKTIMVEARTGYMNKVSGTPSFPRVMHGKIDCFAVYFPLESSCKYYDLTLKEIIL